jgi:hypothetical protein
LSKLNGFFGEGLLVLMMQGLRTSALARKSQ